VSALGRRIGGLSDRMYDRMRHRDAFAAANSPPTAQGFDTLRGRKYCLLVSYRRSGEPVPTPVWFGLDGEGRLYVRTGADAAKVRRIRANARVLVAPANARGRPTGPLAEGTARILPAEEWERAERALRASYGLGRRLYVSTFGRSDEELSYLEISPASPPAQQGAANERATDAHAADVAAPKQGGVQ
jgi:PPOX class probable F420-dependent enzyme